MRPVIYIDLDGTIADFAGGHVNPPKSIYEKTNESLEKGFYRNLPVISGAQEAVALLESHFDVYIATKPKKANPFCLEEKMEWVRANFPSLSNKVFFTPNKALLRGYMLIDDHERWSNFNGKFVQFNNSEHNWIELANQIIKEYQNEKEEEKSFANARAKD